MTTPIPVQTAIVRKITNHYAMLEQDILALQGDLERQLTTQYRVTVQQQLNLYGCQKLATGPDSEAIQWIQAYGEKYSQSIAATYNRELSREVQRIYDGNRKSNRYAYIRALEVWTAKRNAYKIDSIALNTLTAARKYAQDRFTEENNIEGRWVLVGPPPVCKLCIRIKALGPISYKETQKANNVLPRHVGCPHRYGQLIPKKIDCENSWTG